MKNFLIVSAIALSVLSVFSCKQKTADDSYYPKDKASFRLVTYNVGAFSKYLTEGTGSTEMIARMLTEIQADAVGLNECDSCNTRHNTNQVANLAETLGEWQWWFGRAMPYKGGAYGNGIVVPGDVKVLARYTVPLSKGSGSEARSIAVIETDRYVIGAAHLDHRSEEAQLSQVAQVNEWAMRKYGMTGKPVFFMGDMNALPDSGTITALKESWDLLSVTDAGTYPSTDASKCIDYIFHYKCSPAVKVVASGVMTEFHYGDATQASDHLPLYVDVERTF